MKIASKNKAVKNYNMLHEKEMGEAIFPDDCAFSVLLYSLAWLNTEGFAKFGATCIYMIILYLKSKRIHQAISGMFSVTCVSKVRFKYFQLNIQCH